MDQVRVAAKRATLDSLKLEIYPCPLMMLECYASTNYELFILNSHTKNGNKIEIFKDKSKEMFAKNCSASYIAVHSFKAEHWLYDGEYL